MIAGLRAKLLLASSVFTAFGTVPALAQDTGAAPPDLHLQDRTASASAALTVIDEPGIITRDDINPLQPAPGGSLDSGITGIGQMVVNAGAQGLGVCTGSLINPRTVIFAAHCVNTRPDTAYGSASGGTPISFGFEANNLPALRRWLGLDGGTLNATDASRALYNVEQVWYDPRSLNGGFLQGDVALATLDTPAFEIPTWAMLFSPLTGQEHVTITGYGGRGTNASLPPPPSPPGQPPIDWRRRTAENYVAFLGSLADRNEFLFGARSGFEQNLYMTAFNDPAGPAAFDPAQRRWDFGLFGADDVVLPREGITAGGDSGGPLIVDQKYDRDVIIGVLSGGSRFFGNQNFSQYGTHSFYQPLHSFWDVIVANNPYVYATTKGGVGQWTDANHWIQAMDPNYLVDLNGQLINRLPDAPGEGTSGTGAKFGDVCYLGDCQDFTRATESNADGPQFFVQGGPGTQSFVPNNVTGNPRAGVKARYFDVTLAKGVTNLSGADITIDRLTVQGVTKLDVASNASLRVLGDFNQLLGWSNIDGTLRANEAFLLNGVLSGSGTLRAPFFTSVAGIVAPGGQQRFGTLTIDGNAILASASTLFVEANRNGADKLAVTGTLSLSDPINPAAGGAQLIIARAPGAAPRFGQTFTIATAAGGVQGQFGSTFSTLGVLRPEITYTGTEVVANLRAGRLSDLVSKGNLTAGAFAVALDLLRDRSYKSLYNLYGAVDLMDGASLTSALESLAPRASQQGRQLYDRQSRMLSATVTNRLSVLGSGSAQGLTTTGAPLGLMAGARNGGSEATQRLGMAGLTPSGAAATRLPAGMSGFVAGGMMQAATGASAGVSAEQGAHGTWFGMGLEREVRDGLAIGVAVGHASALSNAGSDTARSSVDQVSAYGAYRLGGGAYVGLAANLENATIRSGRVGFDGESTVSLSGAQHAERLGAVAELGVNMGVVPGVTLTPRVQLGYGRTELSGMAEQGGETALRLDGMTVEQVDARLGARLAGSQKLGRGWTFIPELQAEYVHLLAGKDTGLSVRFAAADSVAIHLPVAGGDASWGELRGGLRLDRGLVSFGAGFETSVGRAALRDDRASADITFRF